MDINDVLRKKLLAQTIGDGKIYFFRQGANMCGKPGTDNHPHVCIKVDDRILVISIISSQVDTTRQKMIDFGIVDEKEVPIILKSNENKLTKERSYVECDQTYECTLEDFTERLNDGRIVDTQGTLSETDLLSVIFGVLSSGQVPEEIKERLRRAGGK